MFKNWFKKVEIIKIEPQIMTLKPGDILVLSYEYSLNNDQVYKLREQCDKGFTHKNMILLLEGGGKLSILR